MSGYGYSSDQSYDYTYNNVPQYTQTQINNYYAQYAVYPPQPYIIIEDYPTRTVVPSNYDQTTTTTQSAYLTQTPKIARSRSPKTWRCDLPNCTSTANFTRLADLQRHQSTVHGVGTPDYPCSVKDCSRIGDKGFTRRDHLVEHLRNFHHIDIPKRRAGERSAYPLGLPHYQ
ncbi:hypothetical protein P280DRAFT_474782 [Massarina eburnea CBS 473.64]|uniref:C2H2-type domain-containing protein n=1 Tax=Massarina eburnea CBS 473.64 TaxID=1395130 RepID=A0A6A6RGQ9_9PLEO|nr:hypothetical protein P280DRAFT_474782 [Massarina eburnea CBS 473.64]